MLKRKTLVEGSTPSAPAKSDIDDDSNPLKGDGSLLLWTLQKISEKHILSLCPDHQDYFFRIVSIILWREGTIVI